MASILNVDGLSIAVRTHMVMQNVHFRLEPGEAILLSGANGIGKSMLLKAIMRLEENGKSIKGSIKYKGFGEILSLDGEDLQKYRSSVAYIQQKDEYSELGNVRVRDIISDSSQSFSGKPLNYSEVNDLIDEWIPRKSDNSRVFDAKSKPIRFSGGEQRLLSVLSVIATRLAAELLIIDEPLNNLDFVNARNISNLVNRVMKQNPRMGLLMISHCRIFPFISREIELTQEGIKPVQDLYTCHSCFGHPDENGYFS
ncbi:MAG: ATP-binding cassette domain-containing protein [Clostridiales bacterium]|nr:ATP-binding cassette domain-containing protein [Clostridiales bacterium]